MVSTNARGGTRPVEARTPATVAVDSIEGTNLIYLDLFRYTYDANSLWCDIPRGLGSQRSSYARSRRDRGSVWCRPGVAARWFDSGRGPTSAFPRCGCLGVFVFLFVLVSVCEKYFCVCSFHMRIPGCGCPVGSFCLLVRSTRVCSCQMKVRKSFSRCSYWRGPV